MSTTFPGPEYIILSILSKLLPYIFKSTEYKKANMTTISDNTDKCDITLQLPHVKHTHTKAMSIIVFFRAALHFYHLPNFMFDTNIFE
jgi:hypothetical protein